MANNPSNPASWATLPTLISQRRQHPTHAIVSRRQPQFTAADPHRTLFRQKKIRIGDADANLQHFSNQISRSTRYLHSADVESREIAGAGICSSLRTALPFLAVVYPAGGRIEQSLERRIKVSGVDFSRIWMSNVLRCMSRGQNPVLDTVQLAERDSLVLGDRASLSEANAPAQSR